MKRPSKAFPCKLIFAALITLPVIPACSTSSGPDAVVKTAANPRLGDLCRLAISLEMGRPLSIIKTDNENSSLADVSYARPDDGKTWKYQCKSEGTNVYWRGVDLDGPGSGPGRWRDNPFDNKLTYSESRGKIVIKMTYPDGNSSEASLN